MASKTPDPKYVYVYPTGPGSPCVGYTNKYDKYYETPVQGLNFRPELVSVHVVLP